MAHLKNSGPDEFKKMSAYSKKSMFKDEEVENYIVVPPDGGWGWVIVVAAFLSNMIADGITFTFGIFLEELSNAFNVTIGTVTLIGSVMNFFYYLSGPFVSALVNRYGFRCVAILGSSLSAIGFVAGSFCYDYYLFAFFVGVLTGLGCGMVTIPAVIVVGYYFEKWRALATGMATCGSGIGTLLTPPIVNFLLNNFDWRDTFRILACICVGPALLAIFYRPLSPVKAVQDEKEIRIIQSESIGTFVSEVNEGCCRTCSCSCTHHNRNYPTTAHFVPIDTAVLERHDYDDDISSYSHNTHTTPIVTNYTSSVTQVILAESRTMPIRRRKCERHCLSCLRILSCSRFQTVSRPMYRDDIFFGHSLSLLPQYQESLANHQRSRKLKMHHIQTSRGIPKSTSTGYHMSVTRVTTHREIYSRSNEDDCCSCHLAVIRTLSTMLDLQLMKSPAFQMFAWNGMFIVFGYMVPYLYIKDRAIDGNIPEDKAFWLLSAIGAANTVGRIISGILPSLTNIKVIEYSYFCISVAGLMTILSGLSMRVEYQFAYACIYGIAGSCIATLRPIIVVELFGLENLTNAFGLQMMYMAVAVFVGTMVAGILYDCTNNYNNCFYMAGGCLMFSAFMLPFIRKLRVYEIKHCNINLT